MVNILPSFYLEMYLTPMSDCLNATLPSFEKPVAARCRRWTVNGFIGLVVGSGGKATDEHQDRRSGDCDEVQSQQWQSSPRSDGLDDT
jgi:hypothetical protein